MTDDHRPSPLVLGIETSCDDTACAVVDGEGRVLSSTVSSQLDVHQPFGGVVPEIASREHLVNWNPVVARALETAGVELSSIDAVAATRGPGLVGSLLVGLSLGKAIAYALDRSFHGVHHLEGHLYSPFLAESGSDVVAQDTPDRFVALVVSGGHTSLFSVEEGEVSTLAETRDDAMGEVFDKVGKRLGLAYPQGPWVDRLAERGDASRFRMTVARFSDGSGDFSYSGLKSQALLAIEALERDDVATQAVHASDTTGKSNDLPELDPAVCDLLAGFREAAVRQIIRRLDRLRRERDIPLLAVSGGAAANRLLRRRLTEWCAEHGVDLRLVPLRFSGDNAAMIAYAALLRERRGERDDPRTAEAASRIPL